MRELVIGDMHFGIKSNSVEWLKKQCELLNTQVTKIIKEDNIERIVFLGDVFDVRYSINQQVASEVKECIRNLALLCAFGHRSSCKQRSEVYGNDNRWISNRQGQIL